MKTLRSSIAIALFTSHLLCFLYLNCTEAAVPCVSEGNVCDGVGETNYNRPLPGCSKYATCRHGEIYEFKTCPDQQIFDVLLRQCNWEIDSFCIVQSCTPTPAPYASPSDTPTIDITDKPSDFPSASPTGFDFFQTLEDNFMRKKIESVVLSSYNPAGIAYPSTKYTHEGLIKSLRTMVSGIYSDGRTFKFNVFSNDRRDRIDYGLTNLAAFLANVMTESIATDTCDEFNIDQVADRYAISNACGQNSRSYQDEVCMNSEERDMSCSVDLNMKITSSGYSTNMMGRAPPPFSCRPKANEYDYAGYWESRSGASSKTAYGNALGRTDLEGCCWWGRGSLLTRGVCNIGKLNYYLGKRAYDERGEGMFPTIDFCANPEATCASEEGTEEMRWITGFFEWVERIQSYQEWDYIDNLISFVDNGMVDDSFIDTVSSIFTIGCHEPNCSWTLKVTMKEKRKENFKKVLEMFGLPDKTAAPTFSRPRPLATPNPTTSKPVTRSPVKSILPPSLSQPQPTSPISSPTNQNGDTVPISQPNQNPANGPTQPAIPTQQSMPQPSAPPVGNDAAQPGLPTQGGSPTQQVLVTLNPTDINPENELIPLEGNQASLLDGSWLTLIIAIPFCICYFL